MKHSRVDINTPVPPKLHKATLQAIRYERMMEDQRLDGLKKILLSKMEASTKPSDDARAA